jgi:hypothetical protein
MSNRRKSRGGRPSEYLSEVLRDAVSLVLDEVRQATDVARSLAVNEGTLGNWVGLERMERGERDGLTADERAALADLRVGVHAAGAGQEPNRPDGVHLGGSFTLRGPVTGAAQRTGGRVALGEERCPVEDLEGDQVHEDTAARHHSASSCHVNTEVW